MNIDLDEGKQFYVRRIEFQGNTTTRDKVIRRELLLQEGQVYNGNLWEISLLRLNQLQYFEPLKAEQDSEIHQNVADSTVDITLKLHEKGKNSIGLTGGVSGLAGGFIGLNYTTNNLFGKGESLTLEFQIGQYERNETLAFTQPYLFDKPLQFSWSVYHRSYNYNQAALTQQQTNQVIRFRRRTRTCCRTSPRPVRDSPRRSAIRSSGHSSASASPTRSTTPAFRLSAPRRHCTLRASTSAASTVRTR